MTTRRYAGIFPVAALLFGSGAAFAKNGAQASPEPQAQIAAAQPKPKKTDVGPPNGFPDSPGLQVARDRANENAAFNRRYDSPGT